jgi:hypothetical protein
MRSCPVTVTPDKVLEASANFGTHLISQEPDAKFCIL